MKQADEQTQPAPNQRLTLTVPRLARYAEAFPRSDLLITLNGDPHELDHPVSVVDLLARLGIDSRRVAVEHNLTILKRETFARTMVGHGDTVEIVNFVGGGQPRPGAGSE